MVQSTTRVRHHELPTPQPPTNSVLKPTKVLSTQVSVHSIDLASPAAGGRKAALHSKVSPVSFGRFHAGQHHQRLGLRVLLEILHQATVARRIRTTARWLARRAKRVMVVPTLNSGAVLAITPPAHHHRLPFRPRLHRPPLLLLLLHKSRRLSYWVLLPRLPSVLQHIQATVSFASPTTVWWSDH
jgi:hypothetical protein